MRLAGLAVRMYKTAVIDVLRWFVVWRQPRERQMPRAEMQNAGEMAELAKGRGYVGLPRTGHGLGKAAADAAAEKE